MMNIKSMFVGFLIAVIAASGTYFFYPPVKSVQAQSKCATSDELYEVRGNITNLLLMDSRVNRIEILGAIETLDAKH